MIRSKDHARYFKTSALAVLVCIAYGILSVNCLAPGHPAAIWIMPGISVSILHFLGRRYWPVIFISGVFATLYGGQAWYIAVFFAVGAVSEALLAQYIFQTLLQRRMLIENLANTYATVSAAVISTLTGASVICTGLLASNLLDESKFSERFYVWWAGRALGILVVLPILYRFHESRRFRLWLGKAKANKILFFSGLISAGFIVTFLGATQTIFTIKAALGLTLGGHNVILHQVVITSIVITCIALMDLKDVEKPRQPIAFLVVGWFACAATLSILGGAVWVSGVVAIISLLLGIVAANLTSLRARSDRIVRLKIEELKGFNERWAAFMRAAPVGVFLTDAFGNNFYTNRSYQKFFGREARELLDTKWLKYIHPEDRRHVEAEWYTAVQSNRLFSVTCRALRSNNQQIWAHITADRVAEDQDYGFVGFVTDITELKHKETIVANQQLQFLHASRMASLGEMAGGIAHEINTPLGIISGKTHIIQKNLNQEQFDKEKLLLDVAKIDSTTQRIAKIIRGLRTFSRNPENDTFSKCTLQQIVDDTLELCREKMKNHSIALRLAISENVDLDCRPTQVAQVLLNLLNNSHDAVEGKDGAWIEVACETTKDSVMVMVTDSGTGLSPEIASKIMQPFFTTKEIGKGTGLGLSIAKGLVEGHNGKLWYDGTCKNTRFCFELPRTQTVIRFTDFETV